MIYLGVRRADGRLCQYHPRGRGSGVQSRPSPLTPLPEGEGIRAGQECQLLKLNVPVREQRAPDGIGIFDIEGGEEGLRLEV